MSIKIYCENCGAEIKDGEKFTKMIKQEVDNLHLISLRKEKDY